MNRKALKHNVETVRQKPQDERSTIVFSHNLPNAVGNEKLFCLPELLKTVIVLSLTVSPLFIMSFWKGKNYTAGFWL